MNHPRPRQKLALLVAALAAAPMLVACGSGSDGPNVLTFWHDPDRSGVVAQIREKLGVLEEAGVERVMLQYQTHADLDGVGYIAELAD